MMARISSQSFPEFRQSSRILRTHKSHVIVHGEKKFIGSVYFMRISKREKENYYKDRERIY